MAYWLKRLEWRWPSPRWPFCWFIWTGYVAGLVFYDWSLAAWSRAPANDIVIVAIDEQSLRELGRWPWSRRIHATLVQTLTAAGAKAIALDIAFVEPTATDPWPTRNWQSRWLPMAAWYCRCSTRSFG